ncbi:L-asparaginase [Yersinia enterocolitica]|nr:L-asparaginase [Yersinia enterocolitica]PNM15945.1 L-asparaginase [Yersinia enterocolitica]PNM26162.1 L-asparaginase [Yersinia enterocolitica]
MAGRPLLYDRLLRVAILRLCSAQNPHVLRVRSGFSALYALSLA